MEKVKTKKKKETNKREENHNNTYRDVKRSYYNTCTQFTLNGYSLY